MHLIYTMLLRRPLARAVISWAKVELSVISVAGQATAVWSIPADSLWGVNKVQSTSHFAATANGTKFAPVSQSF